MTHLGSHDLEDSKHLTSFTSSEGKVTSSKLAAMIVGHLLLKQRSMGHLWLPEMFHLAFRASRFCN